MKKYGKRILAIAVFLIAVYLTEMPPFGSEAVASVNGGYGTFDMNAYDTETVSTVLSQTAPENLGFYDRYYVCDFLFIAVCGFLQVVILANLYRGKSKLLQAAVISVPVLRGLTDAIENIILIGTIHSYPEISPGLIDTCNRITGLKFVCMGIWILLVIAGIIFRKRNAR